MGDGPKITTVSNVPTDSTFLFTLRDTDTSEEKEAILTRVDGEITAWLNYCQHLIHIRLDKGTGGLLRNGEIVCTNHGAHFRITDGYCTYGPCEGAYLTKVSVVTEDNIVFLDDQQYEFIDTGPISTESIDLSSTSNIEF